MLSRAACISNDTLLLGKVYSNNFKVFPFLKSIHTTGSSELVFGHNFRKTIAQPRGFNAKTCA